jgi:transposase InsO family protein
MALTTMFTAAKQSYTICNWMDVLLEYDFEIRHRPGVQMVLPDALSRLFAPNDNADPPDVEAIRALSIIENADAPDLALAEFIRERHNKETIDSVEEQVQLLRATHAAGHFGAEHLFKKVWRDGFFWPGMRKQCDDVVKSCHPCLSYNIGRHGFHPTRSLRADNPCDHFAVDCAVDLPVSQQGNACILIVVDVATRYVIAKPLPNTQEHTIARALFEIFTMIGPPKIMQSDRGTEFINKVLAKLVAAAGIDHRLVAPYNPQANGLAERAVKTIKDTLKKKLVGKFDRWDEALPAALWAINTKEHALTKTAPFTLFFGRSASGWSDYSSMEMSFIRSDQASRKSVVLQPAEVQRLVEDRDLFEKSIRTGVAAGTDKRRLRNNERLDKGRLSHDTRIKEGALVYIIDQNRSSKLTPVNLGPFLVERQSKRALTFYLRNLNTDKVYDTPFVIHHLLFADDTNLPIADGEGAALTKLEGSQSILKILGDRPSEDGTSTEYKVRWRAKKTKDSWLPASHFDIGFLTNHVRLTRPFKKRKQPPRLAKSAYEY